MKANKTAAPAKTANPASLTDGVEGVVSFPSCGFASFRFEIVARNEKLHIWLEDRKTKKQWNVGSRLCVYSSKRTNPARLNPTLYTAGKQRSSRLQTSSQKDRSSRKPRLTTMPRYGLR
jgi:hypothetical protein